MSQFSSLDWCLPGVQGTRNLLAPDCDLRSSQAPNLSLLERKGTENHLLDGTIQVHEVIARTTNLRPCDCAAFIRFVWGSKELNSILLH